MKNEKLNILITGASGFIGSGLVKKIADLNRPDIRVVGIDVREPSVSFERESFTFHLLDIRHPKLKEIIHQNDITHVVHLASIVTPGKNSNRDHEYSVDVEGTSNLLHAIKDSPVTQLIITSSGAAYGYHSDNDLWLDEQAPLRGNFEFAYSYHKRIVEELLLKFRTDSPHIRQLILRPGTILGRFANNQITDLFKKPFILGIKDSSSPFVFIWDEDLIEIILKGLLGDAEGIYNVAGDGALSLAEIADILNKRYLPLPSEGLKYALSILKKLKLTQYGPEQVKFLQYRPVLKNEKLKNIFGYKPRFTSKECFLEYLKYQS
jgi:UDP-glucose 4-epimerase